MLFVTFRHGCTKLTQSYSQKSRKVKDRKDAYKGCHKVKDRNRGRRTKQPFIDMQPRIDAPAGQGWGPLFRSAIPSDASPAVLFAARHRAARHETARRETARRESAEPKCPRTSRSPLRTGAKLKAGQSWSTFVRVPSITRAPFDRMTSLELNEQTSSLRRVPSITKEISGISRAPSLHVMVTRTATA